MKMNADTTLIEAARHIAPVIRAHKDEAERERRLSKPVLDALTQAGLMRMLTPRSLGGLEVDPLTCALVIEEVATAQLDGASSTHCHGRLSAPACLMRAPKRSSGGIRIP
jgi:alkylation response protein AidB-like acyl-CoA dehydrogenase